MESDFSVESIVGRYDAFQNSEDPGKSRLYAKVISERYSVLELIEIIDSYRRGDHLHGWIARIDEILDYLETELPEEEDRLNVKNARDGLCVYSAFLSISPRLTALFRSTVCFCLECLHYAGITHLSEISNYEDEDYFYVQYQKVISSVIFASTLTFMRQIKSFMSNKIVHPVEYNDLTENELVELGDAKKDISPGIWRDFNDYLKQKGDIFNEDEVEGCVIM